MLRLRCFHWVGTRQDSTRVTATSYAYSRSQLNQKLLTKGLRLNKVIEAKIPLYYHILSGIKSPQIDEFLFRVVTLLESGFSIADALKQLEEQDSQAELNVLIHHLRQDILSGLTLSQSLSQFSFIDKSLIEYVTIGESNGQLAQCLTWALKQRERKANIRKKLRSALTYPLIIFIVALLVLVVMLVFVLPQFEALFKGFGAELPALTQLTLALSTWLQTHLITITIASAFVLWFMVKLLRSSKTLRFSFHRLQLNLPIVGFAIQMGEWARFSLILSSSLKAGLPIVKAWQNASSVLGNTYLRAQLVHAREQIEQGSSLTDAIQGIPTLPEHLAILMHVGESTGRLSELLERVSYLLEQRLIDITDNLGKLIEPIVILFLGGIIGTLVLSIYLPIFSLMNSLH